MANLTIDEAMSLIRGYLDRVAADAETYMKDYIRSHADNPTGRLEQSIDTRVISESARGVGSSLDYAKFADQGRGPVVAKNAPVLHWQYPRPDGPWHSAKSVGPAKGIHFIEATAEHIRTTHIGLK